MIHLAAATQRARARTHKTKTLNVKMMRRKAFERKTTFDRYYEMKPDIHRIRFMRTFSHWNFGQFYSRLSGIAPNNSFILWYCLGVAAQVRARQFLRHSWVKYLSLHVSQWKRIGFRDTALALKFWSDAEVFDLVTVSKQIDAQISQENLVPTEMSAHICSFSAVETFSSLLRPPGVKNILGQSVRSN